MPLTSTAILAEMERSGLAGPGWTLLPAAGGLNNSVFFALDAGRQPRLTVRDVRNRARLGVEEQALRQLEGVSGVPLLRGVFDGRLLVHDFVPGAPGPLAGASDGQLGDLAGVLAAIHSHATSTFTVWPAIMPRTGTRADCFRARLQSLDHFESYHAGLPPVLHQRIHELIDGLERLSHFEASWRGRTFAQLHGDLSAGNILWAGDAVWLLDWEYARQGDPAEELAYLLTEQELPRERWDVLRDAYIAAGGLPGVWERLPAYLPLVTLDSALWWADYLRARDVDPATHAEFMGRLEQSERLMGR